MYIFLYNYHELKGSNNSSYTFVFIHFSKNRVVFKLLPCFIQFCSEQGRFYYLSTLFSNLLSQIYARLYKCPYPNIQINYRGNICDSITLLSEISIQINARILSYPLILIFFFISGLFHNPHTFIFRLHM